MKRKNWLKALSCSVFAGLYLIVAIISLICSTEFFTLAHSGTMSWVLAIGFEVGAMSCLLSTLILPKKKLGLVWFMFIVLTLFQCMGNMYAAFINLQNFKDWIDMFGMQDMEVIAQKRTLAAISGVILPLVALGFIRIMADVLQDGHEIEINDDTEVEETKSLFLSEEEKNGQEMTQNAPDRQTDFESEVLYDESRDMQEDKVILPSIGNEVTAMQEESEKANSEEHTESDSTHVTEKPKQLYKTKIWNPSLNAELG